MKTQTGIVKKTVITFYDIVLKSGKTIRLTDKQVKDNFITDGQKLTGICHTDEKQDKYTNGEYANSYSITEHFEITKDK